MMVKRGLARSEWILSGPETQKVLEGWSMRHIQVWEPPTDVYEIEAGLVIRVEIAGVEAEDLSIAVSNRTLTITGLRRDLDAKQAFYQMEIRYGEFHTEVYLPWAVDADQVQATYEAGFLRVVVPRPSARRVPVLRVGDPTESEGCK